MPILVVGAGFAGAVVARELAEKGGYQVCVIDKRDHLAGNAYDPIDPNSGGRFHKYGPHIFHTNSESVFRYLSRFTKWLPYTHRVQALLGGGSTVPLPINLQTMRSYFGVDLPDAEAMQMFLERERVPIENPANAEEYLYSLYGKELTEVFFARYTEKMWDLTLAEMPISLVSRLPVRYTQDANYFDDEFQFMPDKGYLALFEEMLDHPNIEVRLSTTFDKRLESDFEHVFNSMPIDDYFDSEFGPLPYRSIRFEHRYNEKFEFDVPTVNFTDTGQYTRKTAWGLYPGCESAPGKHVTYEIPCSYEENGFERYYPIKTVDGWPQKRYQQYKALAAEKGKVTFIGRCGQYIYYDMHQVVANSLSISRNFIESRRVNAGGA